jgi:hypothetical protein
LQFVRALFQRAQAFKRLQRAFRLSRRRFQHDRARDRFFSLADNELGALIWGFSAVRSPWQAIFSGNMGMLSTEDLSVTPVVDSATVSDPVSSVPLTCQPSADADPTATALSTSATSGATTTSFALDIVIDLLPIHDRRHSVIRSAFDLAALFE